MSLPSPGAENELCIKNIVEKPGNNKCAECFAYDPTHANLSLGVFVCEKCSKHHRKLRKGNGEIVAILSNKWVEAQLKFFDEKGNKIVNEELEKHLPVFYHRPSGDDPPILRQQWVKAKYDREEFKLVSQQSSYNQGSKTGALFKRPKDGEKFRRRKFVLQDKEGTLQYFIKYSDKVPKDTIPVRSIANVYMVPDKIGNENGMQITYEKDGQRRNIYLFGEDGKTTSDWYHALRCAMAKHKYKNFPASEVKRYLNTKILREGWMMKTGPKRLEKFRKRWFTLVGNTIWYCANPLDAYPLGFIPLGSKTFGYGVIKGFPYGNKLEGFGMTIHTPERVYVLNCDNTDSRNRWYECVSKVLDSCTGIKIREESRKLIDKSLSTKRADAAKVEKRNTGQSSVSDSDSNTSPALEKNAILGNFPELKPKSGSIISANYGKNKLDKILAGTDWQESEEVKRESAFRYSFASESEVPTTSTVPLANDQDQDQLPTSDYGSENMLTQHKPASKKYSDDSAFNDSDEEIVVARKSFSVSSLTDIDSEDDIVTELQDANSGYSSTNSSRNEARPHHYENHIIRSSTPNLDSEFRSGGKLTPSKPPRKGPQVESRSLSSSRSESPALSLSPPASQIDNNPTLNDVTTNEDGDDGKETGSKSQFFCDIQRDDHNTVRSSRASSYTNDPVDWDRMNLISPRRIGGHERRTIKRMESTKINEDRGRRVSGESLKSITSSEHKEISPRPVDVTVYNHMDEKLWFLMFQAELNSDDVESYVRPWAGSQISETPASVGPIRIPSEVEIAVIDTGPGVFQMQRTTGPFYAEPGDIWEVEIARDDGSAPEMYYHEGMSTGDDTILIYANGNNVNKFEVAVFKSGRKVLGRRNVKPGDSASIQLRNSIYVLPLDQDAYEELEEEDLRASEYLPRASCIDISYKSSKMKVVAKKRGENIFFTNDKLRQSRQGSYYKQEPKSIRRDK